MAYESYQAKAPGSLMLFGEHAVLHGSSALVTAIDQHINVTITPRADNNIILSSDLLGTLETSLTNFSQLITTPKPYSISSEILTTSSWRTPGPSETKTKLQNITNNSAWQFVLQTIISQLPHIKSGFEFSIKSDFSSKIGFGSSAATVAAILKALNKWLKIKHNNQELITIGRNIIQKVQTIGSGADVAASVLGGVVYYHPNKIAERIADSIPIITRYSGAKVKTIVAIEKVNNFSKKYPTIINELYKTINLITEEAKIAITNKDWQKVGELMNIHHELQSALGTSTSTLDKIANELRSEKNVLGAKISGAGLGDSVIAIVASNK
ncbi:MAG: mevalonate kinase [Gammaproteobacteria bacterium]|nr:mevalonate kinase [Gammaproteobacteria bacterium]